jgi:hypothetical protein
MLPTSDERLRVHPMKVTGPGGLSPSTPSKAAPRAGAGGGFSVAAPQGVSAPAQVSSASGVGGVMGVEALLALQDVGTATERRRRSVSRAGRLLDALDDIKVALLGGELSGGDLEQLSRAIREQRADTEDAKLEGILDEIETRAAVELAKLEGARRAA